MKRTLLLTSFPLFIRHCYENHPNVDEWVECFQLEGFKSVVYSNNLFTISEIEYTFFVLKFG